MTIDINKLGPEVVGIVGLISDSFHGQISTFISAHPQISMWAAIAVVILNKFATPPSTVPAVNPPQGPAA